MKMSVFEAGMIGCFGISWPVAIIKTYKAKVVSGKSRMFLILVLSGYGFGILHKIFFSLDWVLLLYVFNFSMVLIELCLYLHYNKPGHSVSLTQAEGGGARRAPIPSPAEVEPTPATEGS